MTEINEKIIKKIEIVKKIKKMEKRSDGNKKKTKKIDYEKKK